MDSNPPLLAGVFPGNLVESLTAQDVCVMHLAGISFSRGCMVCEPTTDKVLNLVDEIMTDGFVTDTEPLLLDVSPTHLEEATVHTYDRIPPWVMRLMDNDLSAYSVCAPTSRRPALSHCMSS